MHSSLKCKGFFSVFRFYSRQKWKILSQNPKQSKRYIHFYSGYWRNAQSGCKRNVEEKKNTQTINANHINEIMLTLPIDMSKEKKIEKDARSKSDLHTDVYAICMVCLYTYMYIKVGHLFVWWICGFSIEKLIHPKIIRSLHVQCVPSISEFINMYWNALSTCVPLLRTQFIRVVCLRPDHSATSW